jgi:hypothetical protein
MQLLSNVLLSTSVCSICEYFVPRKWQTWKIACLHQILLQTWEKWYKNPSNVLMFSRTDSGKRSRMVFQVQKYVTSVEDGRCSGLHWWAKLEDVDQVKEFVHENRRITICNVADILRISSGSVQSILKDSLNTRQIASSWVRSRRRIVSAHARTFKGGLEEAQNSFWR